MNSSNQIVEWFAGIGGFHCAWLELKKFFIQSTANPTEYDFPEEQFIAIDINQNAKSVYKKNFSGRYETLAIESMDASRLKGIGIQKGGFWWMSPPCQPYTRRGLKKQEHDRRSEALDLLISLIPYFRPEKLALENVPEFWNSLPYHRLIQTLRMEGYDVGARFLCPTQLGIPMKRKRFFLIASKSESVEAFDDITKPKETYHFDSEPSPTKPLSDFLTPAEKVTEMPEFLLEQEIIEKYHEGMNVIEPPYTESIANCFTKAYSKSFSKSGSYLRTTDQNIRRFIPEEMLRLFGFPETFQFPDSIPIKSQYALIGNSLSVDCVRFCLNYL